MKKFLLILLNVVLFAAILFSASQLVSVLQERNLATFIKEKQTEFAPKSTADKQTGNIDTTYVTAYFPTDSSNQRIAPLADAINQQIRQTVGEQKPAGQIKKVAFATTTTADTNFPTVHKSEVQLTTYKVNGFQMKEESKQTGASVLLKEDNQIFTLATFFVDPTAAKAVLSQALQKTLEAKSLATDAYLANFENQDLSKLSFDYSASKLILKLSEAEFGVAELSLDIQQFFDSVDSQYLASEDKTAYDAYQAEKEKKAKEKMIALTFDDGPSSATTPQALDILKKYNIKATFFVLGQHVAGNEDILKRMKAEGHEIANHSWSHPNLVTLSADQVKQEIDQTQNAIASVVGEKPVLLRPPYGSVNQAVLSAANLPAIYWSVDSLDWKSHNPQAILQIVQQSTYPGGIILMHDIHQTTIDSLPAVIEYLKGQGYSFGTVSELLGDNLNPQMVYYDRNTAKPAS